MLQRLDNNKVVAHGEGPKLLIGGDVYTVLAAGADTAGRYAAFAFFVPPGGGPPPHRHTREDEFFYVTEGELTLDLAGTEVVLRPGDFAHAARGTRHSFRNASDRPARALVVACPAGLDDFFREVGTPVAGDVDARRPPPRSPGIVAAAPKYGLELFPPGA